MNNLNQIIKGNLRNNTVYKGIPKREIEAQKKFLRMLTFINRLMRDEWAVFMYSKYDADNSNNAYRLMIRESINKICKRIENTYKQIGFHNAYFIMDDMATENSDAIEDTVNAVRNKMIANLMDKMAYDKIKPLSHIIMCYVFCDMGKSLMKHTTQQYMYTELMELLDVYSDKLKIDLWCEIEMVRDVFTDDMADMLLKKIFELI